MKKVGILTLYEDNYNYGGILQAYALNKTIRELGFECETLSYKSDYNPIYPNKFMQLKQYSFIDASKKLINKMKSKVGSKKFKKKYEHRLEKIESFKNEMIPHSKKINDESLKVEVKKYDYLISGSDQVWNPNCGSIGYLQMFRKDSIKKISYAASISRNELTHRDREIMIPAINDFDSISVREVTAKNLLEKDVKQNISIVLDPTLLLDKNDWDEIAKEEKLRFDEEYVLCYFFSNSIQYRNSILNFCKKKNYKLLYIPYARQEYNSFDGKGEGIRIEYASIQDFVSLFKNAQYVFTDSFHGTVFSIIYGKKFLTVYREKDTKVSMNSRMRDLLKKLDLEKRIVDSIDEKSMEFIELDVNYKKIYKDIEKYKEESIDFLKNALK